MSIIERIPMANGATRVRFPPIRFSAPFAAGQYDFDQAGNTDVEIMGVTAGNLYLLTSSSFFANVSESDWLESMDTKANFPSYVLRFKNDSNPSIFPDPIQCVNYTDGMDQLVYFESGRSDGQLLITFKGIVNQTAGMVGVDPLLAEVNLTIYQISNKDFIEEWRRMHWRGGNNGL